MCNVTGNSAWQSTDHRTLPVHINSIYKNALIILLQWMYIILYNHYQYRTLPTLVLQNSVSILHLPFWVSSQTMGGRGWVFQYGIVSGLAIVSGQVSGLGGRVVVLVSPVGFAVG